MACLLLTDGEVRALPQVEKHLFLQLIRVGLPEVEWRGEVELEVKHSQELQLFLSDLSWGDGSVSNLLRYHLGVQWHHILVLGCQVECGDTDQVDLPVF